MFSSSFSFILWISSLLKLSFRLLFLSSVNLIDFEPTELPNFLLSKFYVFLCSNGIWFIFLVVDALALIFLNKLKSPFYYFGLLFSSRFLSIFSSICLFALSTSCSTLNASLVYSDLILPLLILILLSFIFSSYS